MSRGWAWALVLVASFVTYYVTVQRVSYAAVKSAAGFFEPQVVAAAEKGYRTGYEAGLKKGV